MSVPKYSMSRTYAFRPDACVSFKDFLTSSDFFSSEVVNERR